MTCQCPLGQCRVCRGTENFCEVDLTPSLVTQPWGKTDYTELTKYLV